MNKYKERISSFLYNMLSLGIVIFLWYLLSNWQNSPYFPKLSEISSAFTSLAQEGDIEGVFLSEHIWASLLRIFAGFGAACIVGIPLGLAMGLWPKLYYRTRSVIEPIRFIPPLAWIPIAIVFMVGFQRYVFLIWLGAFFPILVTTLLSVYIIRKIVLPSVAPDIATGMRVGLGIAWMCILAAEMIGGEMVGVGRLILKYAELLRMSEILVGMMIIGFIGFIMNEIFIMVENYIFRWRSEVSID